MSIETQMKLQGDALRLHTQAAAQRAEAEALIATLTPEQWTWSPDAQTWNMALILDHLASVGNLMLPKIEEAIKKLRAERQFSDRPFRYAWPERFFIRILSPNPPFKVPVPPLYIPKLHADPATEIGPIFLENGTRFLHCLESANGLDWTKRKIPSPAVSWMNFTLGCWLEGNVGHEQYHWLQVKALQAHPQYPKTR